MVGDLHFPFHSKPGLTWLFSIIPKLKPSFIIQVGDLYDLYSMSRFPKNPNLMTPLQELKEARQTAIEFWAHIRRLSKGTTCVQLLGNHDVRMSKLVESKLPELCGVARFNSLWQFPGVNTQQDDREEYIHRGICFMHGYFSQPGKHLRRNGMNTVIGHTHRPWLHYEPVRDKTLWEMNVGYLADPTAKQLAYTRQRWTTWTQGVGWIDDLGPRFIPFPGGR